MKKNVKTVQQWIPIEKVINNGIIKFKDNSYVKILKVSPINYNLKSNLEKESILNSYKIFLKTCNFNIQILIQSKKEDLTKHIAIIQKNELNSNQFISQKYINYIQDINQKRKSSSKNFYILIKENPENKKQKINQEIERIKCDNLNEKYLKIKECLARCGNNVIQIDNREEVKQILNSFFNSRKEFNLA